VKGVDVMGELVVLEDYKKKVAALELENLKQQVDNAMSKLSIYPEGYIIDGISPECIYDSVNEIDISSTSSSLTWSVWDDPVSSYSSHGYYSYENDDES